jgi:hypothetical protein
MTTYRRESGKKYRSALRKIVQGQDEPASKPLPLTHVTDCIWLEAILRDRHLDPRPCGVFGDSRLYAFYARPAYRSSKKGSLNNLNFAPICFIVDASVANECTPVEIFPFDTGALKDGILSEHVHSGLNLFDFALEPKIASAQRLAKAFFGSDRNYYTVNPSLSKKLTYLPTDAEVVAYDSLVKRTGRGPEDERGTSIEIQFKDRLQLTGKVLAVILPQEFLDVPAICTALTKEKIDPLPYPFILDHSVKEVVGVFYSMVSEYYTRKKKRQGWQW